MPQRATRPVLASLSCVLLVLGDASARLVLVACWSPLDAAGPGAKMLTMRASSETFPLGADWRWKWRGCPALQPVCTSGKQRCVP